MAVRGKNGISYLYEPGKGLVYFRFDKSLSPILSLFDGDVLINFINIALHS